MKQHKHHNRLHTKNHLGQGFTFVPNLTNINHSQDLELKENLKYTKYIKPLKTTASSIPSETATTKTRFYNASLELQETYPIEALDAAHPQSKYIPIFTSYTRTSIQNTSTQSSPDACIGTATVVSIRGPLHPLRVYCTARWYGSEANE